MKLNEIVCEAVVKETPEIKKARQLVKKLGEKSASLLDKMLKLDRSAPASTISDKEKTKLKNIRASIEKALDEMRKNNIELIKAVDRRDNLLTQFRLQNNKH